MGLGAANAGRAGCTFECLDGLAKRAPILAASITLGGLSLIGIPLTAGFVSKWFLLQAALETGARWAVVLLAVASLLAVAYVWIFISVIYFRPSPADAPKPPRFMTAMTVVMTALILVLGVYAEPVASLARQAGEILIAGWSTPL
jgi:multicomponent Na+:H+ antiporter subunit D